jgi:phenylpropionate dioxygenase-like ring-hydroxylating dioxygenase large terminal subunit
MGPVRSVADITKLVRPDAVHREIYKDPAVFTEEMDRIFGRTWVFVGHESEIPEPGDYRTISIGTQPVIFARDQSGQIRVLVNRCRHRGATVCQAAAGNATSFRCHYHGWTYRADGRLVGVPYPDRYDSDIRDASGLLCLPQVGSYRGLVFASFNEHVPPLLEHLGPLAVGYLDRWLDHCGGRPLIASKECHQLVVGSNWKLQVENGLDGYHGGFTHRSFFDLMQQRTGKSVRYASGLPTAQTKAFQHGNAAVDPETTSKQPLVNRIAALPGADEALAQLRSEVSDETEYQSLLEGLPGPGINLGIFPNLQLIGIHLRRIQPIAVDQTVVTVRPLLLRDGPPEFNELRLRYHELFYGPAGFGQPDDLEMFARVDEGLDAQADHWVRLDRGIGLEEKFGEMSVGNVTDETPMRAQYREWLRLMTCV